ncbi:unnamed protein product [Gongylonema pulchrum]|uniref:Integrase n=1 Tax=Gongylonema pulchrum TaxID=637853 RepID=A0A183DRF7_9BILA|nr:unnamed protein product [Gongylonema pulchrum]
MARKPSMVDFGNELTPTQVKDRPKVSWEADSNSLYTLVMTGLHRYVFLVYKQPGKISDPAHGHLTNRSGAKRGGFKIANFAKKHNLGNPIAGNFYQVEFVSLELVHSIY